MSTSELRRGPGWWMDLDGQWNPPEEWPEANPPLPGWKRRPDGMWFDPQVAANDRHDEVDTAGDPGPPVGTPGLVNQRPIPEVSTLPSLDSLRAPNMMGADSAPTSHAAAGMVDRRKSDRRSNPTPTQSALSFAEGTADLSIAQAIEVRRLREGVTAAFVAAVTASMLAAGLVLLLLLL